MLTTRVAAVAPAIGEDIDLETIESLEVVHE